MRRALGTMLLAVLACAAAAAQAPEPFRIAVDVNLVALHATVRDGKGRIVSNLVEQNFEVYEDDVRQEIRLFRNEDAPVTVGIVVDHSGSMRPKLAQVVAAAVAFVRSSHPEDEMFVVNFNENVSLGLPKSNPFTNDPAALESAVSRAPATGMTALYDATNLALEKLRDAGRDKKVLLIISDGGDNASKTSLDHVLKMAGESGAILYTIGLSHDEDPDRDPGTLKRMARESGGEAYFPEELSSVVAVCEEIARDIRSQYTVGYFSTSAKPKDAYRSIRMVAHAPGHKRLTVRTRAGYVAGSAKAQADH